MSLYLTVLPMALGSAISPIILLTTTVVLTSDERPRARALAMLAGAVAALAAWAVAALAAWAVVVTSALRTVVTSVADTAIDRAEATGAVGDLVLGVALLVVAAVVVRRPPRPPHPHHQASTADRSLWQLVVLGAVLQGRDVSSMLLFTAAVQHVAVAEVPIVERVVVVALVMVVTTSPIWVPIVGHVRVPTSLQARTTRLGAWLTAHLTLITAGVCTVFGLYLLVRAAFLR